MKKELKRGKLGQLREFPGTFGIKVGHDYTKIESKNGEKENEGFGFAMPENLDEFMNARN